MHQYYLLALLPAALGCLNTDTNACASYMKSNAAASTFCATFTKSTVTATTALPAWATNCSQKPSLISAECTCAYSGAGGSSPTTTLKTTTTAGGSTPTGDLGIKRRFQPQVRLATIIVNRAPNWPLRSRLYAAVELDFQSDRDTTTLPKSTGATSTSKAITVSAGQSYDGGMKKFDRSPRVCAEQDETGEADAMFVLEAGATLSNVIIGPDQAEAHCMETTRREDMENSRLTVYSNNVWWEDVCEDALTLKQTSGTSYVNGGGAFKAADKIVQFNGFRTVSIKNVGFPITG
ncbi:pectate lyase [Colletotrichum cuscutae]|uniref:Pectate lyase n=1 Tax=Colletotrichum cuscutae TaxID=1209917 RepID=A0AAJ0DL47_9PEZI|nr:pectate lyase [Colletotrichum cuscutae]